MPLVAQHFYAMWRDLGIPGDDMQPNWLAIALEFVTTARQTLDYQAFVAEVEEAIIGSAGGQRFSGLYPPILSPQHRQYGYIWGVYVEPAYRRQGIATQLTQLVVNHLKVIGCTKAVLNAAPQARSLYETLGFCQSNLMELDLAPRVGEMKMAKPPCPICPPSFRSSFPMSPASSPSPSDSLPPTSRSQVQRLPQRATYDRQQVYDILDEALVCHLGFVVNNQPFVIPYRLRTPRRQGSTSTVLRPAAC
jgi:GNAT superfamily N-acetyltransferase